MIPDMKNILLMITPSNPGRFAGIARYAKEHSWHLTVADRLTHTLSGWTGDGALVTLRDDDTVVDYVKALRRRSIPVVDLSNSRPEIKLPRVCADNPAIGRIAAKHFLDRNFRRAAWFSTAWSPQHQARYDAFAETFREGGNRETPPAWCWSTASDRATDDWKALSKWLTRLIKTSPRPLGIFCYDDSDASLVENTAVSAGFSVPDEIAVLGAGNDEPLCEAQAIAISSVRNDMERNGRTGAELLNRLIHEREDPQSASGKTAMKPVLISPDGIAERASTDAYAVDSELVRRAVAIYRGDLAHPPSTVELAEALDVSRATLDRAFNSDTGTSPAKILSRLRLDEARRLLRDTGKSVAKIARVLGYSTPSHFSNAFSDRFGVSPRKFRNAMEI